MSDDLERGVSGAAAGVAAGLMDGRVQRKLARDVAGYLDEGEKLVSPVVLASHGGRRLVFSGLGVSILTLVTLAIIGDRIGFAGDVVVIVELALAVLLGLVALLFIHGYDVVLTDRRLLVFRARKSFYPRVRDLFIAVPRSDVSSAFKDWWALGVLRLEFPPATGQAPLQLDVTYVYIGIAESIHRALTTPAGSATGRMQSPDLPMGR